MTEPDWGYWRFDDDDGLPPLFVKRSNLEPDSFLLVKGRWKLIDPRKWGGQNDPFAWSVGTGEGTRITLADVPLLPDK